MSKRLSRAGLTGNLINNLMKPRIVSLLMAGHAPRGVTHSRWITKVTNISKLFVFGVSSHHQRGFLYKESVHPNTGARFFCKSNPEIDRLLNLSNDSLESFRMIYCQVGENLTVDLDTTFVQKSHQLRIAHTFQTSSSIDTLNPQSTEVALLRTTIAVSIGKTFLPSILGNSPNILTSTKITSGEFQDFLSF